MIATLLLASLGNAQATVDPLCQDVADAGAPGDYDEQAQADFLLNYYAMVTTLSPNHGPTGDDPGHGTVGVELLGIPPLSCERRLVLNYTKTEDTNKSPVIPRIRLSFTFPELGAWELYSGISYVMPFSVMNVRNVLIGGELGAGRTFSMPMTKSGHKRSFQLGARYHATMLKVVGEVATPFSEDDEAFDDLYLGSTMGFDVMAGLEVGSFLPYLSVGVADASTFFYIGDDDFIGNNYSPYFGPTVSLGTEADVLDWLYLAGEVYYAPGAVLTGRIRAAYKL
jgi:hypothetical protein